MTLSAHNSKRLVYILLVFSVLFVSRCDLEDNSSSWKWPSPATGFPPEEDQVGPRISLESADGGSLEPGSYSGKRFTTEVSLASSGEYAFTDCEFQLGIATVFGGESVTRSVTLDHCVCLVGLYFEEGGQTNWTIRWCHLLGVNQALRPKGLVIVRDDIFDYSTPTPFEVSDSIVEITSMGTPEAHCEAMQSLGGNSMAFIRVRFITPGPYVDNVTGQTAAINHGGGDTLFDRCDFLEKNAFYFTVYSNGGNVLFRNCRMAQGLAGHIYWDSPIMATYEGCTDLDSGEPIVLE